MKTAKDFFERLKADETFAKEFAETLKAKREAGVSGLYETVIPAAEESGYSVSREELDEFISSQESELSEEELGKVAGGSELFTIVISLVTISGLATFSEYAGN